MIAIRVCGAGLGCRYLEWHSWGPHPCRSWWPCRRGWRSWCLWSPLSWEGQRSLLPPRIAGALHPLPARTGVKESTTSTQQRRTHAERNHSKKGRGMTYPWAEGLEDALIYTAVLNSDVTSWALQLSPKILTSNCIFSRKQRQKTLLCHYP